MNGGYMYLEKEADESKEHFLERQIQEKLFEIREQSCSIIHQTSCYLNDGNIERFKLVENILQNIEDLTIKLRELHKQKGK